MYRPSVLETTVRSSPVRSFLTTTVAPGTTAPDGSSTTPTNRASAWANAMAGNKKPMASTNATDAFQVFIRSKTPLKNSFVLCRSEAIGDM